jgi:hypothetical protein
VSSDGCHVALKAATEDICSVICGLRKAVTPPKLYTAEHNELDGFIKFCMVLVPASLFVSSNARLTRRGLKVHHVRVNALKYERETTNPIC